MSALPPNASRSTWGRFLPLLLYHALFLCVVVVYAPIGVWRFLSSRRYRGALRERCGLVPRTVGDRPVVWVHGVSVGEVKGLGRLITALEQRDPQVEVVVSATTPTGFALARQLYAPRRIVRYPIDLGLFPGWALDRIRPIAVVLMELEVWPNFLQAASRRGVPVVVVNGRISERSFRNYRLVRGLLPQFDWIALFCVQNDAYRDRLCALGVPTERIAITGNMKYDGVSLLDPPAAAQDLRRWLGADGHRVLVAGSTHAREDEWLVDAVRAVSRRLGQEIRLVLVPRHPDRAPAVAEQVRARGVPLTVWSEIGERRPALPPGGVVLVDAIGHLEAFYGAADLVFVGGSLVPHGGQNMLEPAALGRAVVFGPHTDNFRADVELLLGADAAVVVPDRAALEDAFEALLTDPDRCRGLGERAVAMIRANQGATTRTRDLIAPWIAEGLRARRA
ncbi:MAG: 3-deoxy-D-manno-octulosonic acid transferase [Planctomycetota bacterium]